MENQPAQLLSTLQQGLIVSCQAPSGSPLHAPDTIAAMAKAAVQGGAVAVRIDTPSHIAAVRAQMPHIPIIGLWKQQYPGYEVYITPSFADAYAVAQAGADIIAIDATNRPRPNQITVVDLVTRIHQELGSLVMADVDTIDNACTAATVGADLLATTLYGYTAQTQTSDPPGWELLTQMVRELNVPAICEGGISSPVMAKKALDLGAYAVVVGTAITGIDRKIQDFQAVFT